MTRNSQEKKRAHDGQGDAHHKKQKTVVPPQTGKPSSSKRTVVDELPKNKRKQLSSAESKSQRRSQRAAAREFERKLKNRTAVGIEHLDDTESEDDDYVPPSSADDTDVQIVDNAPSPPQQPVSAKKRNKSSKKGRKTAPKLKPFYESDTEPENEIVDTTHDDADGSGQESNDEVEDDAVSLLSDEELVVEQVIDSLFKKKNPSNRNRRRRVIKYTRNLQKQLCTVLSKAGFDTMVRDVTQQLVDNFTRANIMHSSTPETAISFKFESDAMRALQMFTEQTTRTVLHDTVAHVTRPLERETLYGGDIEQYLNMVKEIDPLTKWVASLTSSHYDKILSITAKIVDTVNNLPQPDASVTASLAP